MHLTLPRGTQAISTRTPTH